MAKRRLPPLKALPAFEAAARHASLSAAAHEMHLTHGAISRQVKALETHRGHCSDYHGFCAAMGRAMGYPTRVTYGINTFPKNSPSHCKLSR